MNFAPRLLEIIAKSLKTSSTAIPSLNHWRTGTTQVKLFIALLRLQMFICPNTFINFTQHSTGADGCRKFLMTLFPKMFPPAFLDGNHLKRNLNQSWTPFPAVNCLLRTNVLTFSKHMVIWNHLFETTACSKFSGWNFVINQHIRSFFKKSASTCSWSIFSGLISLWPGGVYQF